MFNKLVPSLSQSSHFLFPSLPHEEVGKGKVWCAINFSSLDIYSVERDTYLVWVFALGRALQAPLNAWTISSLTRCPLTIDRHALHIVATTDVPVCFYLQFGKMFYSTASS